MKAALYARVSTTDKGQDVEIQLRQLRAWAEARGHTVTEYVDDGVSGSKRSRPALDRMLTDARRGLVGIVAVAAFDRLGRSSAHLATLAEELVALKVQLVSLREAVDTSTPMGAAVFNMAGVFAQLERDVIRDRVTQGIAAAKARGVHCGRPAKAVSVAAIEALRAQGFGYKRIARELGVSARTIQRRLTREEA